MDGYTSTATLIHANDIVGIKLPFAIKQKNRARAKRREPIERD
jgi:hypothetical protein